MNATHSRLLVGEQEPEPVRLRTRNSILAGVAVVALGLGGTAVWAATAPLASAVMAQATVRVESHAKTIQHLQGGIVSELLVREGDRVVAGQVLARIDALEDQALQRTLEGQYLALLAQEARLAAERAESNAVSFPRPVQAALSRPEVAEMVASQRRIFDSRSAMLAGQKEVLDQKVAQLQAQVDALAAQHQAAREQFDLVQQEVATVRQLTAAGLERKPRLLSLEREMARLKGSLGDFQGRIAQAREAIAATRAEALNLRRTAVSDAAQEMGDVQARREEVETRLRAAEVKLGRTLVTAPQSGRVMTMRVFAAGAVVPPGGPILDLVPDGDRLVVDARLQPQDIDAVHAGQAARVVLSAYKSRTTPQVDARVDSVSADALTDERSGQPYYLVRVVVDASQLADLPEIALQPGMPAEVLILGASRTLLEYLAQPLTDSFRHAFREL